MSGNLSGFDANTVEPNGGFDVIPAGEYDACIVGSQVKATKSGTGNFLELQLQILNGPFQNRMVFDRLNLWNTSDQATQIAKGTLSAICRAVGVLKPNDSSELHTKPMRIKLAVQKSDEYGDSNVVKSYRARNRQPAQPQAAAPSKSPWPAATQDPQPSYQDTARQAESVF